MQLLLLAVCFVCMEARGARCADNTYQSKIHVDSNKQPFWIYVFSLAQQNTWSRPLRERLTSRGRVPKVPARILVQSDLAAQGRQASGAVPKERHTSEAQVHCRPLRGAQGCQTPDTACSRLTRFGRWPQEVATPQPEGFSSHLTK